MAIRKKDLIRFSEGKQRADIGEYQCLVDRALTALGDQAFSRRLWEKDASLWRQSRSTEKAIKKMLGWLDVVDSMWEHMGEIKGFADEVKNAGFTDAVLIGMGGSSLSPQVSLKTFGVKEGYPKLRVLDSSVPAEILNIERLIDVPSTFFIISSKSGNTIETLSGYRYFFEKVKAKKGDKVGENFAAITDEGTALEKEAKDHNFRRTFLNPKDIGGRFSALSYLGLVPTAVIGANISELLGRAAAMVESCGADIPTEDNPGVALGVTMSELASMGRDKVTLIASPEIASFCDWAEQLLAESTGKQGTGLIPVTHEPLMDPEFYAADRQFIYLRLAGTKFPELDEGLDELKKAGHPVITIHLDDVYDIGQEYFRWEIAVATVGSLFGINPFDQPNVQESKENTVRIIGEYLRNGWVEEHPSVMQEDGLTLYCDAETRTTLDKIRAAGEYADHSLLSYIAAHLAQFEPGNYIALTAFVEPSSEVDEILTCMRAELAAGLKAATTFGYGPRFLHSTGQLHKGGPNTGMFIQFTADDAKDVYIPGSQYSFGVLKQAEEMGDAISLRGKGRPLIRLHLGKDVRGNINRVLDMISQAVEARKR